MIFIGGTEGSGTRLVSVICRKAKLQWTGKINESLDSMEMVPFFNRWTEKYISGNYNYEEMKNHFQDCVNGHIGENKDEQYFVKIPQNLLVLPFIHSVYPNMRFIHVVRDGRSMAFSNTRRHVKKYGHMFSDGLDKKIVDKKINVVWSPEKAINFWAKTNIKAFEYGTKNMGNKYILLKYEQLCTKNIDLYKKLAKFLGCSAELVPNMMRKAKVKDTFKRWKNHPVETIRRLEEIAGADVFNMLGYKYPILQ